MRNGALIGLVLCMTLGTAWGAEYANRQQHRQWASFTYAKQAGGQSVGLATVGVDDAERSELFFSYHPPACGVISFPAVVVCNQNAGSPAVTSLPGRASIRVDRREVYEADIQYNVRGNCVVASVQRVYGSDSLLNDLTRGDTLRFKLQAQGRSPVYKRYSLAGLNEAASRARELCAGIAEQNRARKSEPAAPKAEAAPKSKPAPRAVPPREKSDADYF